MKKVIKAFKKLSKSVQNELYLDYSEGELERAVFPYNGSLEEGVLFETDDCVYLVPVSSIIEVMSSHSKELEDDDDDDGDSDDVEFDDVSDEE